MAARSPEPGGAEHHYPPLLVICGPTATGKTALSLAIAEQLPGAEIISADSRQVYRGMDIGTAKVSPADRARVPHHGLDIVDPDQRFTAADYVAHAHTALRGIGQRGGLAILVGGTGLYLRAVARGMPLDETGSGPQIRQRIEQQLAGEGLHTLVARLRSTAPGVAARTDLANPRRVVRALERVELVGDQPPPSPRGYPGQVAWLGLDTERQAHDRWIAERARAQLKGGLIEEASALRAAYDPALPAFSAVGYREAFAVLDGQLTLDAAIELNAHRNRQLARRQRTWFRAEEGVEWLDASADTLPRALEVARGLVRTSD